eukprot:m.9303 g.9303  ORF g.9303 m.9303 type:complete len:246 (+) comp4040_c0_seq1:46-783(+)
MFRFLSSARGLGASAAVGVAGCSILGGDTVERKSNAECTVITKYARNTNREKSSNLWSSNSLSSICRPVACEGDNTILYIGAGVAAASLAAYIYFNPSSAEDDTDAGSQVARMKKAADKGDGSAQFVYANLLKEGKELPQDLPEAVKYFTMAANQGIAEAHTELGVAYDRGFGVEQNVQKALEHFKAGAEGDDPRSAFYLAWSYYYGQGLPQDINQAIALLQKAQTQGHPRAGELLAIINKELAG